MRRFVLIAKPGVAHSSDLDLIQTLPDTRLLDKSGERAALVEAPAEALPEIQKCLPGWIIEEERLYEMPDTQFSIPRKDSENN